MNRNRLLDILFQAFVDAITLSPLFGKTRRPGAPAQLFDDKSLGTFLNKARSESGPVIKNRLQGTLVTARRWQRRARLTALSVEAERVRQDQKSKGILEHCS